MIAVGVDGYPKGWVAVVLEDGRFARAAAFARFEQVLAAFPEAAAIGVDIPIGLPPPYPRPADVEAREFVGPRWQSVFLTPLREAFAADGYGEATAINKRLTGHGISKQAYMLRPKILEVDQLKADERVVEAHPEVSFRELAGRPLASKHTWNGLIERMRLLPLPDRVAIDVPAEDLLDAAAAAWTANRYALGQALPLPSGHAGRVGAIWR